MSDIDNLEKVRELQLQYQVKRRDIQTNAERIEIDGSDAAAYKHRVDVLKIDACRNIAMTLASMRGVQRLSFDQAKDQLRNHLDDTAEHEGYEEVRGLYRDAIASLVEIYQPAS